MTSIIGTNETLLLQYIDGKKQASKKIIRTYN